MSDDWQERMKRKEDAEAVRREAEHEAWLGARSAETAAHAGAQAHAEAARIESEALRDVRHASLRTEEMRLEFMRGEVEAARLFYAASLDAVSAQQQASEAKRDYWRERAERERA